MAEIGHKPDTSGTSGQDTDAHGVMVARARALIPQLRERAGKTEELRRLPAETERDLHETGLFRVLQPKRVGGSELDYVALVDCADAWVRRMLPWHGILPIWRAITGCSRCSIRERSMRFGMRTPTR